MAQHILVAGAGTMGAGIAQCFLAYGYQVHLVDGNAAAIEKAVASIEKGIATLILKGKIPAHSAYHKGRLSTSTGELPPLCDIFIEAIIEDLSAKRVLFAKVRAAFPEAMLCSNTSSIAIASIAEGLPNTQLVLGLHFFNPAPLMPLVEVVYTSQSSLEVIEQAMSLCLSIQKTPVKAMDSPGFIVNRVARSYYTESMHNLPDEPEQFARVDALLEGAGFAMGPFKLMDFIGLDINHAVTTSLYNALEEPERFLPNPIQAKRVAKGELGRKTGRGIYIYK